MEDQLIGLFSSSAVAVFIIEWLKKNPKFKLLSEESTKFVKTAWAAAFAVLGTVGINYTFNVQEGELVISGLTLTGILTAVITFGWEFVKQYVAQKVLYKVAVKPSAVAAVKIVGED